MVYAKVLFNLIATVGFAPWTPIKYKIMYLIIYVLAPAGGCVRLVASPPILPIFLHLCPPPNLQIMILRYGELIYSRFPRI